MRSRTAAPFLLLATAAFGAYTYYYTDALTSIILHGPPGTGKTTLAEVIAAHTNRAFERENASSVGVGRIREIIQGAEERLATSGRRTGP